jgi:predicted metal-dependent hydrolase
MVSNRRQVKSVVVHWYKQKAREYFMYKVQDYGVRLGVHVLKLAVSDARSQWGSCISESRRVSLQWRLALAPRPVADYVILHEVAHLREMGHNAAFWQVVGSVDSNFKEHRRWLQRHGHRLTL